MFRLNKLCDVLNFGCQGWDELSVCVVIVEDDYVFVLQVNVMVLVSGVKYRVFEVVQFRQISFLWLIKNVCGGEEKLGFVKSYKVSDEVFDVDFLVLLVFELFIVEDLGLE